MQPVTLYVTVNITTVITPPNLYNSPPSIPTADDGSPAEAPIPGPTHPSPEHHLPPSDHQSVEAVEAGNNKPQSREEGSPDATKDLRLVLERANQEMERIDRSNSWQGAVGKIKWVMDALSPIAEVRVIPF
jgi:hypothetical protein